MASNLRTLWRALRHRAAFERDMRDELQFHIDARAADLTRRGMAHDEALRRARVEFGNVVAYQDECRESRGLRLFDDLTADLRFALRGVRRYPMLWTAVTVTLAVSIGATTAMFTFVNAVLLRSLPYPNPEQLVQVFTADAQSDRAGASGAVLGPDFVEWRAQCTVCAEMGAYTAAWPQNLSGGAQPDRVRVASVSNSLFAALGVHPVLGRVFLAGEAGRPLFGESAPASVAPTAAILSHGLWQRRFGSDPLILGKSIKIDGDPATVVGVMPEGFNFPANADVWIPASISERRGNRYLSVIARLRPEVSAGEAQAALATIASRLELAFPATNRGLGIRVVPLHEQIVGDVRRALLVFFGAVGLVLLIACANVASLLLAHAATRTREIAVRVTLGASRLRVVRQLLTESLVLAIGGGTAGVLLSVWLVRTLVALAPDNIPRLSAIAIDVWVLAFALTISCGVGLLFGLAPALHTWRARHADALKQSGVQIAGAARQRLRSGLVVAEVALAMVLLVGAGLLVKSFIQLRDARLGFDTDGVLTASATLPQSGYETTGDAVRFYEEALGRLRSLPNVEAASVVSAVPLGRAGARIQGNITVEGEPRERRGAFPAKLAVSSGYFRAMGIPFRDGRDFDERDTSSAQGVVIVSEGLAKHLWPRERAIGKRINIGFSDETWREVIGVVGDVRQEELAGPMSPALYHPLPQVPGGRRWMVGEVTFVVRPRTAPQAFAADLRRTLRSIDPELPLYDVQVLQHVVRQKVSDPRFYSLLLTAFSTIAVLLAAAGLYGLITYAVNRRTQEIGVRIALGSSRGRVVRLVVGEGMRLAALGIAVGIAAALTLTRLLKEFLYEVAPTDPATFVAIGLGLTLLTLMASLIPAFGAMKIDPIRALRSE